MNESSIDLVQISKFTVFGQPKYYYSCAVFNHLFKHVVDRLVKLPERLAGVKDVAYNLKKPLCFKT